MENKYKQKTKYTYKSYLSSENVTLPTLCSQRKLIDWQTKNESSGDEDSDLGSEEENLYTSI